MIPRPDREDDHYGRDPRTALRDGLSRSRHVVSFVTRAMMGQSVSRSGRAWGPAPSAARAGACARSTLRSDEKRSRRAAGARWNWPMGICSRPIPRILAAPSSSTNDPSLLLDQADDESPKPARSCLRDRGIFHRPADGDPVCWAVDQTGSFLPRGQRLASEDLMVVAPGHPVHGHLGGRPGLVDGITRFDPGPIPRRGGTRPILDRSGRLQRRRARASGPMPKAPRSIKTAAGGAGTAEMVSVGR